MNKSPLYPSQDPMKKLAQEMKLRKLSQKTSQKENRPEKYRAG